MAKGRKMPMGMPGGGNMNNMMKQVQKMQRQMEEMQKNLSKEKWKLHQAEELSW